MTEEQAKQKWCPFSRVAMVKREASRLTYTTPFNRIMEFKTGKLDELPEPVVPFNSFCIGSKCMAWRWQVPFLPEEGKEQSTQGHCGLAGDL